MCYWNIGALSTASAKSTIIYDTVRHYLHNAMAKLVSFIKASI